MPVPSRLDVGKRIYYDFDLNCCVIHGGSPVLDRSMIHAGGLGLRYLSLRSPQRRYAAVSISISVASACARF